MDGTGGKHRPQGDGGDRGAPGGKECAEFFERAGDTFLGGVFVYAETAADFLEALTGKPRDDWRAPHREFQLGPNRPTYPINPYHPLSQLMDFLIQKYGWAEASAHFYRWNAAIGFLRRHEPRLTRLDLVRRNPETKRCDLHSSVIQALMTLPFSGKSGRLRLGAVLKRAAEIRALDPDDDGGC